jgi:hypothetical protein
MGNRTVTSGRHHAVWRTEQSNPTTSRLTNCLTTTSQSFLPDGEVSRPRPSGKIATESKVRGFHSMVRSQARNFLSIWDLWVVMACGLVCGHQHHSTVLKEIAAFHNMASAYSSKTLVSTYKSTRRYNPAEGHQHLHRRKPQASRNVLL